MRTALCLILALPSLALAHGGGLDSNGGHFNRKTGLYHCHREPCFSNQKGKTEPKPAKAERPTKEKKEKNGADEGTD